MLKAGIIGLGNWGRHLVESVQGRSSRIRFVACVAIEQQQVAHAERLGLRVHAEYEALLADDVDAVIVATVNSQHVEHATRAARAGKHVFVEKPVALTRASAEELVRVCEAERITLAAGFNWRFHPGSRALRKLLREEALGTLLHVEGNYSGPSGYRRAPENWRSAAAENPAGGMASRGIHVADQMLSMIGEVEAVCASSARRVLKREIDDTTAVMLRFRNGVTGYLGTMMATAELWRLHVFGSRGWAELRFVEHLPRFELATCMIDGPVETKAFVAGNMEGDELDSFADAVASDARYVVPPQEILHGVSVFEAIAASAAAGSAWMLVAA